jgi:hypothetical protein
LPVRYFGDTKARLGALGRGVSVLVDPADCLTHVHVSLAGSEIDCTEQNKEMFTPL